MKNNYEIIVFSDDWSGLPFSCKHLLSHFLPDTHLIWVETIGLRPPKLNFYDIKRGIQKISGWFTAKNNGKSSLPANLCIVDPFQIPYNHFKAIRKFNMSKMIGSIHRLSAKPHDHQRVVITTWPFLGDMIGRLGENLSIYYRVDDFSEFPGVKGNYIRDLENELIAKVDMVIASAENLADIDSKGTSVRYLPHGVDFDHFSQGLKNRNRNRNRNRNNALQGMRSPRIGFFGLLNSWIDFDLVSQLSTENPEWSFLFIGPSQLPLSSLPSGENVKFIGTVPYDELPSYASCFDVAIIPFKINKLTLSVNPLKLMEYFSLGLPVVSTPLPEVKKYQDHALIASDAESFAEAIQKALMHDSQHARSSRQRIAAGNSWQKKSSKLKYWIETELEKK